MVLVMNKVIVRERDEKQCLQQCIGASNCCTLWEDGFCWRGQQTEGGTACEKPQIGARLLVLVLGLLGVAVGVWAIAKSGAESGVPAASAYAASDADF